MCDQSCLFILLPAVRNKSRFKFRNHTKDIIDQFINRCSIFTEKWPGNRIYHFITCCIWNYYNIFFFLITKSFFSTTIMNHWSDQTSKPDTFQMDWIAQCTWNIKVMSSSLTPVFSFSEGRSNLGCTNSVSDTNFSLFTHTISLILFGIFFAQKIHNLFIFIYYR